MKRSLCLISITICALLFLAAGARAEHIGVNGVNVINDLWTSAADDGWLRFVINPHPNFGFGEEDTAWINAAGNLFPGAHDHHYGDRVEFDYVIDSTIMGVPDNHNPLGDWLTWSGVGGTMTPVSHAQHQHGLPSIENNDWIGTFTAVDVFSLNYPGEGDLRFDGALDFTILGFDGIQLTPGRLTTVWLPGWTHATLWDDYVSRWTWLLPQTHVFIFTVNAGVDGHDGFAQIDAIKATVPAPSTLTLLAFGVLNVARRR